jgi:feruloyl esterase
MDHCSGGIGAWQIGQTGKLAAGASNTTQDNVLMRMVAWVKQGDEYAPETLTGYKFVNDTVELGVELTRSHCKYPKRNVCTDPAYYALASSWTCV